MARIRVQEPIPDTPVTSTESTPPITTEQVKSANNFPQVYLKKKYVLFLLIGLFIVGSIVSLERDKAQLEKKLNQANAVQSAEKDDEATRLRQEIGQSLALPDETPVVSNIQDVTKFKDQAFFRNAQNGDKLMLFAKSGRVVLYRPSTKKVIEFTSFSTNSTPENQTINPSNP